MNLAKPPPQYDERDQSAVRDALSLADKQNVKKGADISMSDANFVLTATNGNRYALRVSNTGVLSTVLL